MSLFNNAIIGASGQGGYRISRSVRLRSSASAYLNRTPASAGNRQTWTWSSWVKRGALGGSSFILQTFGSAGFGIQGSIAFISDTLDFIFDYNAGSRWRLITTAVYRDPSAWYHVVVVADTTNATSTDRLRIYVNGVRVTAFSTANYPTQNANGTLNQAYSHAIGSDTTPSTFFDGYLTEINFIDGQALTPSSFGETNSQTGVWQPKRYAGTYGTNGFYLNFSDNSGVTATTIGKDYSGNGNNWTPSAGISITAGVTYDSMLDVPTLYADGGNGRGNYCTLNPLYKGTNVTPTQGNLKFGMVSGNFHEGVTGTIFPTSGKWYAEFLWNAVTANTTATAVCRNNAPMVTGPCAFQNSVDTNSPTFRSYIVNGNKDTNTTTAAYGSTYTANDTIGVALDLDNGKVWFAKNGTWQASGDPAAGTNAAFTDITGSDGWTFGVSGYGSGVDNCNANFGQQPFTYTPPTGFKALNTQNLPTPTISNGATVMAATTYAGTGASQVVSNAVNGVSMQPDFVWFKRRNVAENHWLVDAIRGVSNGLYSNLTNAEASQPTAVSSFNSNGFTVGADTTGFTNASGSTYIAWQWNAGGSTVTNTSGTISAQVRANATAGFSVVTWTGAGSAGTIGHGLGVTPSMIIIKNRSGIQFWFVNHTSISATQNLYLNDTSSVQSDGIFTSRGSTTFGVGAGVAASSTNYVAYCFAAVAGYSAFGSYTGNASTDGTFVYLGFEPRWVMIKRTDTTGDWQMYDTSRAPINVASNTLYANGAFAEDSNTTNRALDLLSNGFKLRSSASFLNASGGTYVYACFAENPFKLSLAR